MKWVVSPDLVEVRTNSDVRGFSLCKFDPKFNTRLRTISGPPRRIYHYRVGDAQEIKESDFRFQFYSGKIGESNLFYNRRKGPIRFRMSYDRSKNLMITNGPYSYLPLALGEVWPPGLHLANMIIYDLLMDERVLTLHGCVFEYEGRTVCVFSPRRTGKSTLIRTMLSRGARYIDDDTVLTDGAHVYLTPPNDNKTMKQFRDSQGLCPISKIDEIAFSYPHPVSKTNEVAVAHSELLMYTNRVPFLNDILVQALMQSEGRMFGGLFERQEEIIQRLLSSAKITFIKDLSSWGAK
jgi:hypothetical protein